MMLNQIMEYVCEDRYKQAVLIDGDWGIGKTYFIKETLIPRLKEKNRKVYYVSLYGVSSAIEVANEVYASIVNDYFESKLKKKNAEYVNKALNIFRKTLIAGAGYLNINTEELPKLSDFKDIENMIIVFDDLERCEMNINKVLGIINSFVEHNDIKVIVVANQNEIEKMNFKNNLSDKYLVALNNNIKLSCSNIDKEDKVFTKNELKERTKELFADELCFSEIKEKLIGLTVRYSVNFKDIFERMVDQYIIDTDCKIIVSENKERIISHFENSSYYNIRTLVFALISFEKFYKVMKNMNLKEGTEMFYKNEEQHILDYVMYEAIRIKSGKVAQTWDENIRRSRIYIGTKYAFNESLYGYKFVDDYLTECKFDAEEIKSTIHEAINEEQERNALDAKQKSLSFYKMDAWWTLEDEELLGLLGDILEELKEGQYDYDRFKDIIVDLMRMKYNDIDFFEYGNYIKAMSDYMKSYEGEILMRKLTIVSDDPEFAKAYEQIANDLLSAAAQKISETKEEQNAYLVNHELWDDEFEEKCENNSSTYMDDKLFFAYMAPDILVSQFKMASTKEIYNFLAGINRIYNFSNLGDFYKDDISNLEKTLEQFDITELSGGKKTKEIGLKKLKAKLEEALNSIDSNMRWKYSEENDFLE